MELGWVNLFLTADLTLTTFVLFFPALRGTQTFSSSLRSGRALTANPWTWTSLLKPGPACTPPGTGRSPPPPPKAALRRGGFSWNRGRRDRQEGRCHAKDAACSPSGFLSVFNILWCCLVPCSCHSRVGNTWQTCWDRSASGRTFVLAPSPGQLHSLEALAAKVYEFEIFKKNLKANIWCKGRFAYLSK